MTRIRPLTPADDPIPAGQVRIRVAGSFDDLWDFFARRTHEAIAAAAEPDETET